MATYRRPESTMVIVLKTIFQWLIPAADLDRRDGFK